VSAPILLVVLAARVPFGDDTALERGLVDVVDRVVAGELWVWLAVLLAVTIGALHALGPGHGKALVGAYLLGARGRARDAVALGVLVATMHTVSVLLVGALLAATQRAAIGPTIDTVIRTAAAAAVTVLGIGMLHRARQRQRVPVGGHDHDHHHTPAAPVAPLSRAGIVTIAAAGGLLPSPAAVLVLLTTLALGRPVVGILLVAAFGIGLAATLTAIGLLVLKGRAAVDRAAERPVVGRLAAMLPLVSAVAVTAGGLVLLATAVLAWA
jgi:nickel/cobalt transporter (NicO) family protein